MTGREHITVIDNVDELIAESLKPGGDVELWAHPPDEEGVVPEPEPPATQSTNNESSQAEAINEQQHTVEAATPPAQMPIEQQIATEDSDKVATVPGKADLDPFIAFISGKEGNPNLNRSRQLKPSGDIFNRVTSRIPRLPRRLPRPGFSTGD